MPTFMGFVVPADGYGIATKKVGGILATRGWAVVDMCQAADEVWQVAGPAVAMCAADWAPGIVAPDGLALYTMFESTRQPTFRTDVMNRYVSQVIVPSPWGAAMFRDNGVRTPIAVVGLGVDGLDFPRLERRRARPYTFLWTGTPDKRKGWDLAYRAFVRAFGRDPQVQLVLHFRDMPRGVKGCRDPNVKLLGGRLTHARLLELLSEADCFVYPARGEGWGQPPREAACTGLPVIATAWAGLAVGIEEWAMPLRLRGFSRADFGFWDGEDLGQWAEPDPEHLIELMRWCYAHRDEAAVRGQAAAAWLRQNQTWEQTASGIADCGGAAASRRHI